MTLSFKRITSSGNFIKEIDGLRFIAILSVVLFHISIYLVAKEKEIYSDAHFFLLKKILASGTLGVPLFFVISGFILAMPFARFHISNGKAIGLKDFYLRRLTRLEPPYILVLTILLFAMLFIAGTKISFNEGIKSYFASMFYIHNIVYGKAVLPKIIPVAWSLEIEVQFYILAPLLTYIFAIKSVLARRMSMVFFILFFTALRYFINLPFLNLLDFIQFFFIGFLLVDLYISNSFIIPKTKVDGLICLICFVVMWLYNIIDVKSSYQRHVFEIVQLVAIFFFYYYVLLHKVFKLLSSPIITNIGGMCYSIYLLHFSIIFMFGNTLLKHSFSKYASVNIFIFSFLIMFLILVISSAFFLLIERPCMDKNWYKKIFKSKKDI